MEKSFLDELADQVEAIYAEIDAATDAFARDSGIRCRTACGQCCMSPTVEARVVEMLPMARALLESNTHAKVYDAARAATSRACVLYRPDTTDHTLGRCGAYAGRPSICRLFGFAAIRRKHGGPELASCHWHKRLQPEVVAEAQRNIDAGDPVPMFPDFGMRLAGIAPPSSALGELLPINEALQRAIEKMSLGAPVSAESDDFPL